MSYFHHVDSRITLIERVQSLLASVSTRREGLHACRNEGRVGARHLQVPIQRAYFVSPTSRQVQSVSAL